MTQLMKRFAPIAGLLLCVAGCATAPESREGQDYLVSVSDRVVDRMVQQDPRLEPLLQDMYAYAVFPNVGQGGFIVAGGSGNGVVYQDGQPIGFAEMRQGSIGATLGGQTFSELIVFEDEFAFERFKRGNFGLNANASATMIRSGSADRATFNGGVATFIFDEQGAMAEASIGGQTFNYYEQDPTG